MKQMKREKQNDIKVGRVWGMKYIGLDVEGKR